MMDKYALKIACGRVKFDYLIKIKRFQFKS
jgi:hypothetical protein